MRSVAEAKPLIAAARSRTAYQSKLLVQPAGAERVIAAGVGTTAARACSGTPAIAAAAPSLVNFGVSYAGFPADLDLAIVIGLPNGTAVPGQFGGLPQSTATASNGCFSYALTADQLGLASLPSGTYQLQLLAGPDLTPVGEPAQVSVGGDAQLPVRPVPTSP